MDYQLESGSRYHWIPEALKSSMHHRITRESKLRFWQSSLDDLNNFDVFKSERPLIDRVGQGITSPEDLEKLRKMKHAAAKKRREPSNE